MNKSQFLVLSLLSLPAITQAGQAQAGKALQENAWQNARRTRGLKKIIAVPADVWVGKIAKRSVTRLADPLAAEESILGVLTAISEESAEIHDVSLAASSSSSVLASSSAAALVDAASSSLSSSGLSVSSVALSTSASSSSASSASSGVLASSASAAAPAAPEESPKEWLKYYAKGFALAAYGDAENRPIFAGLETEWRALTKYRKTELVQKLALAKRRASAELNRETIEGLHLQYEVMLPKEPEDSALNPLNWPVLSWLAGR
jgi:hypothetical protein